MTQHKILIAGAGLGGLAAASFLMQDGHEVEVYEQAPKLDEIGAGIQISANAMHALRHLGLEAPIRKVGVHPGAYVFRLHDTGEEIQRFALSEEHDACSTSCGRPFMKMGSRLNLSWLAIRSASSMIVIVSSSGPILIVSPTTLSRNAISFRQ